MFGWVTLSNYCDCASYVLNWLEDCYIVRLPLIIGILIFVRVESRLCGGKLEFLHVVSSDSKSRTRS
jgi:hypothetical protein